MAQYFYTKDKRVYTVSNSSELKTYIDFGETELNALLASNYKTAKSLYDYFNGIQNKESTNVKTALDGLHIKYIEYLIRQNTLIEVDESSPET